MPVAATFTRTSPGPICGTSISSSLSGSLNPYIRAARICMRSPRVCRCSATITCAADPVTQDGNMEQPLTSTVALVTGASSGIGEATAVALAGAGAKVALIARRADRLHALTDRIQSRGGTAAAFVTDVADRAQAETVVQQVVTEFGRLDIVVNNAGLMRIGPAAQADPADWDDMLSV